MTSPGPEDASCSTPVNRPKKYHNLDTAVKQPRKFRRHKSDEVDCLRTLREVFGKIDFKGKQKEIVEAGVLGVDIFVSAPTGMGKSLCFQLPAVAEQNTGVTIVVSPLLALMKDQVAKLRSNNIHAAAWTSETSGAERISVIEDLCSKRPAYRLIYITPEKLMTKELINILKHLHQEGRLNRLVVDEAHCISEWGHDFREEYSKLGKFRALFPHTPITALTASATPTVQKDIVSSLNMSMDHLFTVVHPFNRENLFYEVRHLPFTEDSKQFEMIHEYIRKLSNRRGVPSSGVVYARARATCDNLAQYLRNHGIRARPYHRGIPAARLNTTLKEWLDGEACEVVICTVAFGLGIDKGDVRYVIHYDVPKSFEGYYQETGRAGRDGQPAKCILYYSREDAVKAKFFVKKSHKARKTRTGMEPSQRAPRSIEELIAFAENTTTCRHILICRYFGEIIDERDDDLRKEYCDGMCDICKNPEKVRRSAMELSSEQWVMTQLPTLQKQTTSDSGDEGEDVSTTSSVPPAQIISARLARPYAPSIPSNRPRELPSHYDSSSTSFGIRKSLDHSSSTDEAPWPNKRRRVDNKGKDPFGREIYDGPMLRNGLVNGADASPNDFTPPRRKRAAIQDDTSPVSLPSLGNKFRRGVLGDGSTGFGMGGRRVSSLGSFKTPFRTGFDPLAPAPGPAPESDDSILTSTIQQPDTEEPDDLSEQAPVNSIPENLSNSEDEHDEEEDIDLSDSHTSPLLAEVQAILEALPEVDASYSEKIPLHERRAGLEDILTALKRVYLERTQMEATAAWDVVQPGGKRKEFSIIDRAHIIVGCALKLECNAMTYSARRERYTQNIQNRIQALRKLRRRPYPSPDEIAKDEIVHEALKEMKRTCEGYRARN